MNNRTVWTATATLGVKAVILESGNLQHGHNQCVKSTIGLINNHHSHSNVKITPLASSMKQNLHQYQQHCFNISIFSKFDNTIIISTMAVQFLALLTANSENGPREPERSTALEAHHCMTSNRKVGLSYKSTMTRLCTLIYCDDLKDTLKMCEQIINNLLSFLYPSF